MAQNPKYDNDVVNLGYLNKRLGQTEESINKNNSSISQLPKNYSIPPNPPYYKDSLLCYKNKIYKCNTTKLSGVFSWNDWTIAATDDTTLSDFINNTYELEKLEIQEQIDGKVQTYYQEMDPSNEWATDLEKSKHIGDYWYNTTNNTQWRYNRNTTTTPITYGWGQVNVPNSVFDLIDKKKSIYTIKPTSYKKDDLWIIEDTLSDEDLPTGTEENPIAKGDWVFSIADSDTYNKEHWIKRDEDISLSYLEQHYYTIGDIDSSFEELERNTDSKITKAKEEISLNVSQTYTTIEEHNAAINDFDEQIGAINDTITTHETNISNLNVGVGKISASVESIESKTEELSVDIDGVKENIIPTSTVSGPNIHIEDASDKKMVNFEIEGKSTQATKSGKNLLKFSSNRKPGYSISTGGLTFTINNDYSITVNGTNDGSNSYIYIMTGETLSLPAGTFIGGLYNNDFQLIGYDGTKDYYLWNVNTLPSEVNFNDIYILINHNSKGKTFNNVILKPIIVSGESLSTYEPYGVMPSPDYPSEIESVGYRNLLDLSKCTSLNCIINNDGTIKSNISNHYYCELFADYLSSYFMKHLGETFTFSVEPIITGKQISIVIHGTRSDGSTYQEISATSSKSVSITIADNFTNITSVRIRFNRNSSTFTDTETVFSNLMLIKGPQSHSYIPYGKYGIEVKNTGKNLFDKNAQGLILGKILDRDGTIANSGGYAISDYIPVRANKNYYQENFNSYYSCYYDKNKKYLGVCGTQKFTPSQDGYIRTSLLKINLDIAQITQNTVATDYEPYQSNTSLFVLDQPPRSLPNGVKDIAYIKNNILYIDRKVGSKIFDGNDNFSINKSNNDYISFYITNHLAKTLNKKNRMSDNFTTAIWIGEAENLTKECYWQHNVASMGFVILKSRLATPDVAGFKSWLSTHNTQVDYELAEPYTEKIGEVEIPSTFKGVNNIKITDELEPIMNIEYVRDTILSDYVEGQVSNAVAIQERKNAEFQITNEEIKSTVSAISTDLDGAKSSLNSVEEKITSQEKTIKIISKNIDGTTGEIREVTTTNGFTFNYKGLNIYTDENSYNTQINNVGTYYRDGNEVVSKTDKDGFLAKDVKEQGQHSYSYDDTNKIYDFIDEKIEVDGEYCYATFYNGEE